MLYCIEHPDEHFWQAVRNWSDAAAIYRGYYDEEAADIVPEDTFYFNDKAK